MNEPIIAIERVDEVIVRVADRGRGMTGLIRQCMQFVELLVEVSMLVLESDS